MTLRETRGEKEITIDVDSVLCNYGFISRLGPFADWGLEIERNSIVVNQKMETNIPGIYAAGDINTYRGKDKLFATEFCDAPTDVNNAMQYIDAKDQQQPRYSTHIY